MVVQNVARDSLSRMLRRSANRHGDRPAIVCGDVAWSYAEFDRMVDRLAQGLRQRGIAPGDRVGLLARNSHAFMAVRFAVARAGAVLVPINTMLDAASIGYCLEHSGVKELFVDASTAELAVAAAPASVSAIHGMEGETSPCPVGDGITGSWHDLLGDGVHRQDDDNDQDLLQIIYTSGTTSRPKGAMLTHHAVLSQYQSCIFDCEWTADTVALHSLPLFHCAQLDCIIGPALQVGAHNIITATPTAENLIPLLAKQGVTSFFAPPTIWISLLRSPLFDDHDLSRLEKGYYGASIMPIEILQEIRRRLPNLRLWNLYGQTEMAPLATTLKPEDHADRPGSAGRPVLNVETRVVDDAMVDVGIGPIGEIVHRSPHLMSGYWRDEAATAEAFQGGWFHSGDLATLDEEGFITIVDRKKDMIKTGGENVASREVEEVIYQHPAVAEVAVIGVRHPTWIEAVVAVVVPRLDDDLDEAALDSHCRERLTRFKVPKKFIIAHTLPKNASGKILKKDLRQQYDDVLQKG